MFPKIVFMGSPDFAVPALKALSTRYDLMGVVTQPDQPAGRGRTLTPPPVKILAQSIHLPVLQPASLKDENTFKQLVDWEPDMIVVVAFGQILTEECIGSTRSGVYQCPCIFASPMERCCAGPGGYPRWGLRHRGYYYGIGPGG